MLLTGFSAGNIASGHVDDNEHVRPSLETWAKF